MNVARTMSLCTLLLSAACGPGGGTARTAQEGGTDENGATAAPGFDLGARFDDDMSEVTFRVRSARATRIEVWVYDAPMGEAERARIELASEGDVLAVAVPVAELRAPASRTPSTTATASGARTGPTTPAGRRARTPASSPTSTARATG